ICLRCPLAIHQRCHFDRSPALFAGRSGEIPLRFQMQALSTTKAKTKTARRGNRRTVSCTVQTSLPRYFFTFLLLYFFCSNDRGNSNNSPPAETRNESSRAKGSRSNQTTPAVLSPGFSVLVFSARERGSTASLRAKTPEFAGSAA